MNKSTDHFPHGDYDDMVAEEHIAREEDEEDDYVSGYGRTGDGEVSWMQIDYPPPFKSWLIQWGRLMKWAWTLIRDAGRQFATRCVDPECKKVTQILWFSVGGDHLDCLPF